MNRNIITDCKKVNKKEKKLETIYVPIAQLV